MAIYKKIINFKQMINGLSVPPIFVNDLSNVTEEDLKKNKRHLYQEYKDDDVYNTTPSCPCGHLVRENLVGMVCPECKGKVVPVIGRRLEPQIWIRTPKGVAEFINPMIWIILSNYFTVAKNFNVIEWITTTDMVSKKGEAVQEAILAAGIERGYNKFVQNFSSTINKLLLLKDFKGGKGQKRAEMLYVLEKYKDCIFTPYLPVINRNLLVVENFQIGKYKDPTVPMAVNAAEMLLGIDTPGSTLRQAAKENRTAKMLAGNCTFYELYFKDNIASKPGLARKHGCSTSAHYSARTVITSLTRAHKHDELHMPWGAGVGLMRTHLQNKLHRHGMRPNEVFGYLAASVHRYHPLLDSIFKGLINDSPSKSIEGLWVRNPSLARASVELVGVTQFKTDVSDPTTGMSILIVGGYNARNLSTDRLATMLERA